MPQKKYNSDLFFTSIALLLMVLCSQCKRNTDQPLPKKINITLQLKDDSSKQVSGAQCYLLEKQEDYQQSVFDLKVNGSVLDSARSVDGKVTFTINPNKVYWLFIIYFDENRQLNLINDSYENIINQLPKNTNILAEVKLKPADANVAFYVLEGNPLPLFLYFEDDTLVINESRNTAPGSVSDKGVVTKNLKPGKYKVAAKNGQGCLWTQEFTLRRGGFQPILFPTCTKTRVVFWTTPENQSQLPIVILTDQKDTLSILNQAIAAFDCNGSNQIGGAEVYLPEGLTIYNAKGKTCSWIGNLEIKNTNCTPVQLKVCE